MGNELHVAIAAKAFSVVDLKSQSAVVLWKLRLACVNFKHLKERNVYDLIFALFILLCLATDRQKCDFQLALKTLEGVTLHDYEDDA